MFFVGVFWFFWVQCGVEEAVNGDVFWWVAFVVKVFGDPDGFGRYGILDVDAEGRLICHECGDSWLHLGTHVRVHGVSAAAYRERHGLARTTRLVAEPVARKMREGWEANRGLHLAALEASRDPDRARAYSFTRPSGWSAQARASREASARARRKPRLRPGEVRWLAEAGSDLQRWADRARVLIADGYSVTALAEAADITHASAKQRLSRYPARGSG